jgi:hypothetical protein
MSGDKAYILDLVKAKQYTGTFVEVGTWTGDFSEALLKSTQCQRLVCVDPYKFFSDFSYRDAMNLKLHAGAEKRFEAARQRLEKAGNHRVQMLRKLSMDAIHEFQDASLDFVYIDGNHEYKYALEDILAWYSKLKSGGMIAGDDVWSTRLEDYQQNNMLIKFGSDESAWGVFGVYPAVLEAERVLGVKFSIQGTQFYYVKT